MSMLEIIALTSAIATPIATYIIGKRLINQTKNGLISEILGIAKSPEIKNILEGFINQESTQRFLYEVGGLIGSGARTGIGIPKKGGKMSWTDLGLGILGKYLNLPQFSDDGAPPQPQQSNTRERVNLGV